MHENRETSENLLPDQVTGRRKHDRAANRATELIAVEWRYAAGVRFDMVKVITSVERGIAKELEKAAMDQVRSGHCAGGQQKQFAEVAGIQRQARHLFFREVSPPLPWAAGAVCPCPRPGYDGRNRTYFFGEYQGFRQVLGTTQVLSVPTAAERQGIDTPGFPGDTLIVPVNPAIKPILDAYPLPNDPAGPYGARTYETSSKVSTDYDQFSIRMDQKLSSNSQLFARFSWNDVTGPVTNPDQTVLDPSFGIQFFDHQRNASIHKSPPPLRAAGALGLFSE